MSARAKGLIGGLLSLALIAAILAGWHVAIKEGSQGEATAAVASSIDIDASVGEVFSPPPLNHQQPTMSASDAWLSYARLNGSPETSMPSEVTVQLGLLTLPPQADNELAYGYSWTSCPVPMTPGSPTGTLCREWLFLDANTGRQIDDTWQR